MNPQEHNASVDTSDALASASLAAAAQWLSEQPPAVQLESGVWVHPAMLFKGMPLAVPKPVGRPRLVPVRKLYGVDE